MMKQLLKSVLSSLGYQLVWVGKGGKVPVAPLDIVLDLLARKGFKPRHIIDVGANHGSWSRTAMRYFGEATYTLVDPQERLKVHVQDLIEAGKVRWVTAGAGDQRGVLSMTMDDRDDSFTFALSAEQAAQAGKKQFEVEVRTLDDIVAESGLPVPELVKIDAEGFDLKVIDGARSLIGKTEVFTLEASILEPKFENTMLKTLQVMDGLGYQVLDITDLNRSPKHGALWLVELVFIKKGSPLLSTVTSY